MADTLALNGEQPDNVATPRGGARAAYLERRRAATRAAILFAARTVFADASYVDAKIEDIIRAAGVSRATFYAHFDSKLELAVAIYDEIVPQTTALFARLPAVATHDARAVRQWLDDFVGLYLEHRYVTPLIAQLQLFEKGFRARILRDSEELIDLLGESGIAGFRQAMGADDAARRQRMRMRLLFNRVAASCSEIAWEEMSATDADLCLDLVGAEILHYLQS